MRNALITALLLLLAYSLFLSFGPRPADARAQSQWQDNRLTVEGFLHEKRTPRVVFVGSSLTRKLDFSADHDCVSNLAVGGDSVLTGLNVLAISGQHPRMVFVEINVPEWPANTQLVQESSSWLTTHVPLFYTANRPINLGYSFLYSLKKDRSDPSVSPDIFRATLNGQVHAYGKMIPADFLKRQMAEIDASLRKLRDSGTQAILVELPLDGELEQLPHATQARNAFRDAFPTLPMIGYQEFSENVALRTLDGSHLESRSATAVVARLRQHYMSACR